MFLITLFSKIFIVKINIFEGKLALKNVGYHWKALQKKTAQEFVN